MMPELAPSRSPLTSPVARLVAAGTIGFLEFRAAAEIREFVESVGASRCLKVMQYGERVDHSLPATFSLAGAWAIGRTATHYWDWRALIIGNRWSIEALLAIIVLGVTPRRLERHMGVRSGSLGALVVPALGLYVEIAGWRELGAEDWA